MNLEKATVIPLQKFEDEKLLEVKPTRTIAEYCWTSTSSTILYVLENYKVDSCTYIDADMLFYSSPDAIFEEMGANSILITEHRYSPQYAYEMILAGKYCVQFITFKNDEHGLRALKWWRERCIEWCYNRNEDGKFGDQKYLDDWTERFEGVHVLQHLGGGLAPWNIQQYTFSKSDNKFTGTEIKTRNNFDVIFFHFHLLKFYTNGQIELGDRLLTKDLFNFFYKPYLKLLAEVKDKVKKIDDSFDPHGTAKKTLKIKSPLTYIKRKLIGSHNIFYLEKFMEN
jgi:hypothetical protein